jgi:uncharacterized protein
VNFFIEDKADVNFTVSRTGQTPLMHAAIGGFDEAAKLLLAAGADPIRKDHKSKTALDYAVELKP